MEHNQRSPRRILFDFSSSPVGGALRRLNAYQEIAARSEHEITFLVSSLLCSERKHANYSVFPISKSSYGRLFADGKYLERFGNRFDFRFSYGLPVYRRVASVEWLHISNVSPFRLDAAGDVLTTAKQWVLLNRLSKFAHNVDILSAESRYALDLARKALSGPKRFVVLANAPDGLTVEAHPSQSERVPAACTIGTQPYKRLSEVVRVFRSLQKRTTLDELWIIGKRYLKQRIPTGPDIYHLENLSDVELMNRLRTAEVFISSSVIENSPNAALEALLNTRQLLLSDIPPHRELLQDHGVKFSVDSDTKHLFVSNQTDTARRNSRSWIGVWNNMLETMTEALDVSQ